MLCPNYSSEEWKYMELKLGSELAHKVFVSMGSVPDIDLIDELSDAVSGNNLSEVKYELKKIKLPNTEIKLGVAELFETNPELANQVYEALGFNKKINRDSKNVSVISTSKATKESQITPQQKQEAQQLYSQYLDTLTNEPILYKGLRNKSGIIHNTPNHSFFTSSFKIANKWYKDDKGIKAFIVSNKNEIYFKGDYTVGLSILRKQEEDFINNSTNDLIKLDINDIGGQQIQYVINKNTKLLKTTTHFFKIDLFFFAIEANTGKSGLFRA